MKNLFRRTRKARKTQTSLGRQAQRRAKFRSLEDRRLLATFVVNGVEDNTTDDAFVTLREAINSANATPEADTITFDTALTSSGAAKIDLLLGELVVTNPVTISGAGSEMLTIDAGGNSRVVRVTDTAGSVTLTAVTLAHGAAPTGEAGGAVLSDSSDDLTIIDSVIRDSVADTNGGGVRTTAAAIIVTDSTILKSGRYEWWGLDGHAGLVVTGSTIVGNRADNGGGLAAGGRITVVNSTIVGNTAGNSGGGIYGRSTVIGSTIAGNHVEADSFLVKLAVVCSCSMETSRPFKTRLWPGTQICRRQMMCKSAASAPATPWKRAAACSVSRPLRSLPTTMMAIRVRGPTILSESIGKEFCRMTARNQFWLTMVDKRKRSPCCLAALQSMQAATSLPCR
ncbi:MAG: hypothetical protein R3C05_29770 [Pirellulaceae bacterium]